jgi:UDP-galactopyranose mutase
MEIGGYGLIVVGAGFFGSTIAYRVANELGIPVLVVERRDHVGGNSYSRTDAVTGIEYHCYGSHLFHTSNETVWRFVNQFSPFNNYRHRVFSKHDNRIYTVPINLMTINQFFGETLTPGEARALVRHQAAQEAVATPGNLEEKAISLIGRPLYEAFIKGYSAKQWEVPLTSLPQDIINRLPVRFNFNDFYFSDKYEGLPIVGYGEIFRRMLSHRKIRIVTRCDFFDIRSGIAPTVPVVYSGPIDRYFDFRFGELSWRTLDFEMERLEIDDFQGAPVINFPDPDVPFIRIHEFKHLHPERQYGGRTLIMREYARSAGRDDEPYYPVGLAEDRRRYAQYRGLAERETNVIFGGRLGSYKYLDMHQAIGAALACYERQIVPMLKSGGTGG